MKRDNIRKITVVAVFSAIATILMSFGFPLSAIAPSYLEIEFSDLPALLTSFSLGPVWGVLVSLIKNLINLTLTKTGGVGELSNFLLSATFVYISGAIYKRNKTKRTAFIATLCGLISTVIISVFTNYFLVYPVYVELYSFDVVLNMSKALIPSIDSTLDIILIFNAPFTFLKGLLNTILTFIIYKRLSPIIQKGKIR